VINVVGPGYVDGEPAKDLLALDAPVEEIAAKVEGRGVSDVAQVFLRMVPENIFKAAVEGQMLGLIFFAILFGYFMTHLENEFAEPLYRFWDAVFHAAVPVLGCRVPRHDEDDRVDHEDEDDRVDHEVRPDRGLRACGRGDCRDRLQSGGATRHVRNRRAARACRARVYNVAPAASFCRRGKALRYAESLRASTASSSATLPVTMDAVEDNVGVSNKVSSFVLPLGATVNMNGTALYECAAAMFIAQAYGLDLTFGVQFSIVVIALLTSVGVAGVPSASLVAIAIILAAVGLPIEAIGVLMVFDRLLDMARTSINIWGDCSCATIVARLSGEETNVAIDKGAE
jgi:Na+/H+-dicarboxylate symporter